LILFSDTEDLNILNSIYLRIDLILSILKNRNIDIFNYISDLPNNISDLFLKRAKVNLELSNYSDLLYSII
jgi:hypothetical protein